MSHRRLSASEHGLYFVSSDESARVISSFRFFRSRILIHSQPHTSAARTAGLPLASDGRRLSIIVRGIVRT
jgi:hypothetical protein